MWELIRKIHLYAGLAAASFLMMYFLTGFAMVHEKWFPHAEPDRTVRTERPGVAGNLEPDEMATELERRYGIRGKRMEPRGLADGSWRFGWMRPGFNADVRFWASGDSLTLTENRHGLRGVLIGFHRLHGYGGGTLYDIWAFMYDFASAALIVFGFTGLWLWAGGRGERTYAGWLCLAAGITLTASMILYFMYMP